MTIKQWINDYISKMNVNDEITIASIERANIYRYLYEQTQKKEYFTACQQLAELITNNYNNDTLFTEQASLKWMPFYVWFDTNYNSKSNYLSIMEKIKMLDTNYPDSAYIMTLLALVLDEISEEIYEHYHSIQVMLKTRVQKDASQLLSSVLVAYATLIACKKKAVLAEKYKTQAIETVNNRLKTMDKTNFDACDKTELAIYLLSKDQL